MIVVMKRGATPEEIDRVVAEISRLGFTAQFLKGEERTVISAIGTGIAADPQRLEILPGVDSLTRVLKPFKLAGRDHHPGDSTVSLDGVEGCVERVEIGANRVVIMAGPCAVESEEQLYEAAAVVKEAGVAVMRAGAFKPRTSPYSFQGLGEEGLKLIGRVKKEFGLLSVTEAVSPDHFDLVAEYSDIIQIGARNMQNFALLRAAGRIGKPVLLKRGMMNTVEELLLSAEYILAEGNSRVILCERGIRTFESSTRSTFDVSCIPVCKHYSHLPIIADPSHAAGRWHYVSAISRAAIAAGADGLLIEIHPYPERALSDGKQALRPEKFQELMGELRGIASAVGRTL